MKRPAIRGRVGGMRREDVIARLRDHAADLAARGVTGLHLFGSTVRGEAGPESDVDLFLDYDPAIGFSLVDLVDLQDRISDLLANPVDLTTRDSLHPRLRAAIEASAERVL